MVKLYRPNMRRNPRTIFLLRATLRTVERPVMVYSTLCSEYILEDEIQFLVMRKHASSGVTTRFKETRIPIHVANLMKPKSYALKLLQASAGQY